MGCVNTGSKDFQKLAKNNNVSNDTLELIVHKYWIERGSEDLLPSNIYIQAQLGNTKYQESEKYVKQLWKKRYSTPQVVDTLEELQSKIEEAKKFFPPSAIVGYKTNDGKYTLTVKQPVERVNYSSEDLYEGDYPANVKYLDLGINESQEYGIGKVQELFDKFNTDRRTKQLADRIFEIARENGLKIHFNESLPFGVIGRYTNNNTITYKKSFFERDWMNDQKAPIILHEVLHSLSMYVLSEQTKNWEMPDALDKFRMEMNDIYLSVKNNKALKGELGIESVQEFAAELSNPIFRQKLQSIDDRSVWRKVLDAFKSLLGIKTDSTYYNRAMNALDDALNAFDLNTYLRYNGLRSLLQQEYAVNQDINGKPAQEIKRSIEEKIVETLPKASAEGSVVKSTELTDAEKESLNRLKPEYRGKLIYAQSGTGKSFVADNIGVFDSDFLLGEVLGVSTETAGFFFKTLSTEQRDAFGEQYRNLIKQKVSEGKTVLTANPILLEDADVVVYNETAEQADERTNRPDRTINNRWSALDYHKQTLEQINQLKENDNENNKEYITLDSQHYLSDYIGSDSIDSSRSNITGTDSSTATSGQERNNSSRARRSRHGVLKETLIKDFLTEFGITVNHLDNYQNDIPLFDALNRAINAQNVEDITDGVGYAIAFMMQSDPEMQKIILQHHGLEGTYGTKVRDPRKAFITKTPIGQLTRALILKDSIIKNVGQQITTELKKHFGEDVSTVKTNTKNASTWTIIKNFFNKIGSTLLRWTASKGNIAKAARLKKDAKEKEKLFVKDIVAALGREDFSRIKGPLVKPGTSEKAQRVSIEKALRENPFEEDIISKLNSKGIALAGSASVALDGTLFRSSENPLHDIDFNAGNKSSRETMDKVMDELFDEGTWAFSTSIKDFFNQGNSTQTYVVLNQPFVTKNRRDKGFIEDYYSKDGKYLGRREKSELYLESGVQGRLLDFFVGPNRESEHGFHKEKLNGKEYIISNSNAAWAAKILWSRDKDMWDYKHFKRDSYRADEVLAKLNWIDSVSNDQLREQMQDIRQEHSDYELLIPDEKRNSIERAQNNTPQDFTFNDGTTVRTPFKLNNQQEDALNAMNDFINSSERTMTLSGYAGTGKTSLMEIIAKKARQQHKSIIFSASTNKAAAVLKERVSKEGFNAYTLNKVFGINVEVDANKKYDAKNLVPKIKESKLLMSGGIVVIDEASMINSYNYDTINQIARQLNLKIIYVGDEAQLAPVKEDKISKVFRNGDGKVVRLTKVERTNDNAILKEATNIRNGEPMTKESSFNNRGEGVAFIRSDNETSVSNIIKYYVKGLRSNPNYFRILAFTNAAVERYNKAVRRALGYLDPAPVVGEPMTGYANWGYNFRTGSYRLINSEAYKVTRVGKPNIISINIDGENIKLSSIPITLEDSFGNKDTFNYIDIKNNEENRAAATILAREKDRLFDLARKATNKEIKADLYRRINSIEEYLFINDAIKDGKRTLQGKVIDFGYAMTIHKSQGSTFTNVLIDDIDISNASNIREQDVDLELAGFNPEESTLEGTPLEVDLGDLGEITPSTSTKLDRTGNTTDIRQQLRYVAVSRATTTASIITNDVKKEGSPINQQAAETTAASAPTTQEEVSVQNMNNKELWEYLDTLAEPVGERPVSYTPVGKERQHYIVKDGKIFNKEGKEVHYVGKDRNRIFANLALLEDRAVIVTHKENQYVVDNTQTITSVRTGDIMKWGPENGDRRAIIQKAGNTFRSRIEARQQRNSDIVPQIMDLLKAQGITIHDKADMEKFFKANPKWSDKIQQAIEENREMQEIKDKAIADGTFMKAPNGKPTNLNERQWLQVRTKAFKKWFGDWRNPTIFTANNVDDVEALRQKYPSKLPNKFYHHSTNKFGWQAFDGREGTKEKLHIIGRLTTNKVDVLIVENPNSENEISHITLATAEGVKPFESNKELESNQDKIQPLDDYVDTTFTNNLRNDVSKVVDENGEPLVVYHGGKYKKGEKFSVFDVSKSENRFWLSTVIGNKSFFTNNDYLAYKMSNPDYYQREVENLEGSVYEVFLNLKNPLVINAEGRRVDFFIEEHKQELKDNEEIIVNNIDEDGINVTDYIVSNPNQIKSATNNNGEFSTENDDIQMFIGKKARTQFEQQLMKTRPDMSDAEIQSTLDFLHSLEDSKENTAYIKTAIRWVANRSLTLPQDHEKAYQAFELARKKHLDLQKYNTIGELITAPEMQPKKKEKVPFNPDKAKTFSNKRTVTTEGGRVFTVYDVEDTEEGQREVCKALAAHYKMSPWCLSTFTATGEPTESAKRYWKQYDSIPRKIAYEDGKPVAFSSEHLYDSELIHAEKAAERLRERLSENPYNKYIKIKGRYPMSLGIVRVGEEYIISSLGDQKMAYYNLPVDADFTIHTNNTTDNKTIILGLRQGHLKFSHTDNYGRNFYKVIDTTKIKYPNAIKKYIEQGDIEVENSKMVISPYSLELMSSVESIKDSYKKQLAEREKQIADLEKQLKEGYSNREAWWDMEDTHPQDSLSDYIITDKDSKAAMITTAELAAEGLGLLGTPNDINMLVAMQEENIPLTINNVEQYQREWQYRDNIIYDPADFGFGVPTQDERHPQLTMEEIEDLPFFMTPQGEIYGFADFKGDLYFDETVVSPNVQIHEYTHLWDRAVAKRNPKLWKRGIDLMKQTSLWNEVLNEANYGQKWQAMRDMTPKSLESLIASEVHSRLVGTQGEALLNRIVKEKGSKGIVGKLKQWILDFWKELKGTFSSWTDNEINKLTLDDFNKMTVRDLVNKVSPEKQQSSQNIINQEESRSYSSTVNITQNASGRLGSLDKADETAYKEAKETLRNPKANARQIEDATNTLQEIYNRKNAEMQTILAEVAKVSDATFSIEDAAGSWLGGEEYSFRVKVEAKTQEDYDKAIQALSYVAEAARQDAFIENLGEVNKNEVTSGSLLSGEHTPFIHISFDSKLSQQAIAVIQDLFNQESTEDLPLDATITEKEIVFALPTWKLGKDATYEDYLKLYNNWNNKIFSIYDRARNKGNSQTDGRREAEFEGLVGAEYRPDYEKSRFHEAKDAYSEQPERNYSSFRDNYLSEGGISKESKGYLSEQEGQRVKSFVQKLLLSQQQQATQQAEKETLKITPAQSVDRKATAKGSISNKFIGFADGINGSSTAEYARQAGNKANVGTYTSEDTVFVSIPGKRGNAEIRHREQQRTINEALKALRQGATLITDNIEYTNNSQYNEGEKRLAQALQDSGAKYSEKFVDGQTLGVWNLAETSNESILTEESQKVSLPNYERFNELSDSIEVDAAWKIPMLQELDNKIPELLNSGNYVQGSEATLLEQMDKVLKVENKEDLDSPKTKAEKQVEKNLDEFDRLNTQINNLIDSEIISSIEVRHVAELVVNSISDIITSCQTEDGYLQRRFPDLKTDINPKEVSRKKIVDVIGINRLFNLAKDLFSPENADYDDLDVMDQAQLITDNWEAFMYMAADVFAANEGFGIIMNYDNGKFDTAEEVNIDYDNFNSHRDTEATEETYGDEQEHWQVEMRTIDVLTSMSQLVRMALHSCYKYDSEGRKVISKWGIAERVEPRQAVNSILRWVKGSLTYEDMIKKLSDKQLKNPWISQIIQRLKDESGKETDFQSQFFQVFCKHFQNYSVVKLEDGTYKVIPVNSHPALSEAIQAIKTAYKMGEHPMFTLKGINENLLGSPSTTSEDSSFNLHKAHAELSIIIDRIAHGEELTKEMAENAAKNITGVCKSLGYFVSEDTVIDIINKDTITNMNKYLKFMISNLDKALKDLKENPSKEYNPFLYKGDNSIEGTLKNFLTPITDVLEDTAINAFYDSGKMYQSYITPSFLTKLMNKFKLEGEEFDKFIESEYGKSEWFRFKNGDWRPWWLRKLATDENARRIFDHKVELNFNKHNYMRNMTDKEYNISLLTEYFAESAGNNSQYVPAWLRIPMMSNKPSSEFIKFYSIRHRGYRDEIVGGLYDMFLQELSRIQTVRMRGLSEGDDAFIKNFDKNGRKFNFLPFLNDYIDGNKGTTLEEWNSISGVTANLHAGEDARLAKLLQQKIEGKELSSEEEIDLRNLVQKAIKADTNARVQRIMDSWRKDGIMKAAESIEAFGKDEAKIEAGIENFLWNDMFAAKNILQLTITDIAFYKDAEDLQKRLAQLHSPGVRGRVSATDYNGKRVSDGTYRTIILKDFDSFISNIVDNISEVFDRKIAAAPESQKATLRALKESLVAPRTYNPDGSVKDKGGKYRNINVADAQGYSSIHSYRKKAFIFGRWSQEAEKLYDKIKNGEANITDFETAFQPLKPFVYSRAEVNLGVEDAPITSINIPFQAKNSEYLLIMADAIIAAEEEKSGSLSRPNILRAINRAMEETERRYPTKGIDTVQFESAIKGGLQGTLDLNQFLEDSVSGEERAYKYIMNQITQNSQNLDETNYAYDTFVRKLPYEDYCLQQEVPDHFKNHEQSHGSQVRMIIPSDLDYYRNPANGAEESNIVYYEWVDPDGTKRRVKADEFRKEYEETIANNIELSINELAEELHLDATSSKKERNIALSKILQREILSSPRYGIDLVQACTVDKETGEFRIPKGDPIQSKRIEQLINSIIKNRINKQKIAGGPVVQVSNFGTSKQLHIRFKSKKGGLLMTREEFEKTAPKDGKSYNIDAAYKAYIQENQAGIAHFEVFAPAWMSDIYRNFMDKDGNIDIDILELLDPEMLKLITYRIPTEDKYSIAPCKIVGFMPKEAGSAMMLPYELTEIDDSDFDIDKRYVMRKVIDIAFRVEPKEGETMSEAEASYIKHNRKSIVRYLMDKLELQDKPSKGDWEAAAKEAEDIADLRKGKALRKHNEILDKIAYRNRDAEDAIADTKWSNNKEANDRKFDKEYDRQEKFYEKQIAQENERYQKELDKIEEDKINKIVELKEKADKDAIKADRQKLENRIIEFLEIDRLMPAKQDTSFIRELRKAYLSYMYKVIQPTTGRIANNNKIVDMSWAVLTNEMMADKILNPGGFDGPKKAGYMVAAYKNPANKFTWEELQGKSIDELKKLSYIDKDLTWADTQVQFYRQNSAAASLIGVFAVNKVAHATLEGDDVLIDVRNLCGEKPFTIAGFTFGGPRNSRGELLMTEDEFKEAKKTNSNLKDLDYEHYLTANQSKFFTGKMYIDPRYDAQGNLIGKALGSLVSASADAVKDPILNLMNINMSTAGMLNTMVRLGMTFDDAALFLSQNVIEDVLSEFNRENLTGYKSLTEIIESRLQKIREENNIDEYSTINDEELSKNELVEGLTNREHDATDYKVLLAFQKLQNLSNAMRNPTFATRFNSVSSAVGPLIIDNLIIERKMQGFTSKNEGSTNFFSSDGAEIDIYDIFNNHPILKQFARTVPIAGMMLRDMPAGSLGFKNVLGALPPNIAGRFFSDKSLLSSLSDFYQSYLLIASGVINPEELKYYIEEFPKEFVAGKYNEKYPDNDFIKAIKPQTTKKNKRVFLNIKITGMDETKKEQLKSAWIDLHKANPELSKKLFTYCFFRRGIGFSPETFMALVPTYVKERLSTKLENGEIATYNDTYRRFPSVVPALVVDQFIRNNWNIAKIVPLIKELSSADKAIAANKPLIITDSAELAAVGNYDYIRTSKDKKTYLWKRASTSEDGKTVKFFLTKPLGNNGEYLEMSVKDSTNKALDNTTQSSDNIAESEVETKSPVEVDADEAVKSNVVPDYELSKDAEDFVNSIMGFWDTKGLQKTVQDAKNTFEELKKNPDKFGKLLSNIYANLGVQLNEEEAIKKFKKLC